MNKIKTFITSINKKTTSLVGLILGVLGAPLVSSVWSVAQGDLLSRFQYNLLVVVFFFMSVGLLFISYIKHYNIEWNKSDMLHAVVPFVRVVGLFYLMPVCFMSLFNIIDWDYFLSDDYWLLILAFLSFVLFSAAVQFTLSKGTSIKKRLLILSCGFLFLIVEFFWSLFKSFAFVSAASSVLSYLSMFLIKSVSFYGVVLLLFRSEVEVKSEVGKLGQIFAIAVSVITLGASGVRFDFSSVSARVSDIVVSDFSLYFLALRKDDYGTARDVAEHLEARIKYLNLLKQGDSSELDNLRYEYRDDLFIGSMSAETEVLERIVLDDGAWTISSVALLDRYKDMDELTPFQKKLRKATVIQLLERGLFHREDVIFSEEELSGVDQKTIDYLEEAYTPRGLYWNVTRVKDETVYGYVTNDTIFGMVEDSINNPDDIILQQLCITYGPFCSVNYTPDETYDQIEVCIDNWIRLKERGTWVRLSIDNKVQHIWDRMADAYNVMGRYEDGIEHINKHKEKYNTKRGMELLVYFNIKADNLDDAITLCDNNMSYDSIDCRLRFWKSCAYIAKGDMDKSLDAVEEFIVSIGDDYAEWDDEISDLAFYLGCCRIGAYGSGFTIGKPGYTPLISDMTDEQVKRLYDIPVLGEYAQANYKYYTLCGEGSRDCDESISIVTKLIEERQDLGEAYYLRACMYYTSEQYELALNDMKQEPALRNYTAEKVYLIGICMEKLGRKEDALSVFRSLDEHYRYSLTRDPMAILPEARKHADSLRKELGVEW